MSIEGTTQRTSRALPLIAVGIALVTFAIWGVDRGIAALVGGVVSLLNWTTLRWLTKRIMAGRPEQRAAISLLLVAKMGALMAVVIILIHKLRLDPIGLVLGLATLFIAPLVSAAIGIGQSTEPNAAHAAPEEH